LADDVPKERPARNRELLICDLPPTKRCAAPLPAVPPKDWERSIRGTRKPHRQHTQLSEIKRHAITLVCQRFLRFLFDIVSGFCHADCKKWFGELTEANRIVSL